MDLFPLNPPPTEAETLRAAAVFALDQAMGRLPLRAPARTITTDDPASNQANIFAPDPNNPQNDPRFIHYLFSIRYPNYNPLQHALDDPSPLNPVHPLPDASRLPESLPQPPSPIPAPAPPRNEFNRSAWDQRFSPKETPPSYLPLVPTARLPNARRSYNLDDQAGRRNFRRALARYKRRLKTISPDLELDRSRIAPDDPHLFPAPAPGKRHRGNVWGSRRVNVDLIGPSYSEYWTHLFITNEQLPPEQKLADDELVEHFKYQFSQPRTSHMHPKPLSRRALNIKQHRCDYNAGRLCAAQQGKPPPPPARSHPYLHLTDSKGSPLVFRLTTKGSILQQIFP